MRKLSIARRLALVRVGAALAVLAVCCLSAIPASAATISSVAALGPVGGVAGGNYQKPGGLLTLGGLDQLLTSVNDTGQLGTSLRGWRNQAQSFTISASDYPLGVNATGFAVNVRQRHATNNPDFGVRLYPVASATANPLVPTGADLVSTSATGVGSLKYPTQSQLSTSGGGNGTVDYGTFILNFDTPVTLLPGVYAWQFLTEGTGSNGSGANPVWWGTPATGGGTYAGGALYSSDTPTAAGGNMVPTSAGADDTFFGIIGTPVPEPSSIAMIVIGITGVVLCGRYRSAVRA